MLLVAISGAKIDSKQNNLSCPQKDPMKGYLSKERCFKGIHTPLGWPTENIKY